MIQNLDSLYGPLFSLPVSIYEIRFIRKPGKPLQGMESRVRGRMGYHLKRLCCAFTDFTVAVCEQCALAENCRYPELFGPIAGTATIGKDGRFRQAPIPARPYIVALDEAHPRDKNKRKSRSALLLTLFAGHTGEVRLFVEAAMAALVSLSFSIKETGALFPPHLPPPDDNDTMPDIPLHEWLSFDGAQSLNGLSEIGIRFITPVRLKKNKRMVRDEITFSLIVQSIIRRLRDLKRAFMPDGGMGRIGQEFFDAANAVAVCGNHLSWVRHKRFSRRQNQTVVLSGFLGEIRFKGELAPFYPLIKAGEIIHIGKSTSNGNGKMAVLE